METCFVFYTEIYWTLQKYVWDAEMWRIPLKYAKVTIGSSSEMCQVKEICESAAKYVTICMVKYWDFFWNVFGCVSGIMENIESVLKCV